MKPKGVILYLTRSTAEDLRDLKRSLALLDRQFNDRFNYPVLVFHEDLSQEIIAGLQAATRSELRFATVDFRLPEFLDADMVPSKILGRFGVGYRHMCRFFAGRVFFHPALAEFDWYWRLDTDSFLLQPVRYDVFEKMASGSYDYGYMALLKERPGVVEGLWEATVAYAREKRLALDGLEPLRDEGGTWNLRYYYNNFEICRLAFGRSAAYQDYFQYLDRLGGIYFHRWGDAPIRTLAVALFLEPGRRRCFNDIGYTHAGYYSKLHLKVRHRLVPRLRQMLLGSETAA